MLSILVVDGNAVSRDMVIGHLAANGFEAHGASDGDEAVELLQCVGGDAVVLDVALKRPGDGVDFLRAIRRDEYFKVLPVVVYTQPENGREIDQANALGVSCVLDKTTDRLDDLTQRVRDAIASGGKGVCASDG